MTEIIFNPLVASNAQIVYLYNEVAKELTSRWKREMKDGDPLTKRKDEEKEAFHDYITLVKDKLNMEQLIEETSPLEAFKDLVEVIV
jgi:hypothetical protein